MRKNPWYKIFFLTAIVINAIILTVFSTSFLFKKNMEESLRQELEIKLQGDNQKYLSYTESNKGKSQQFKLYQL